MQKITFNKIKAEFPDLLIIAGEHSGDEHGATLIKKLNAKYPHYHICAIGGDNMEKTGIDFLFNLVKYSVVGIMEVFRNIHFFSKFLKITCDWIEQHRPKVVCFIDFPGLNLRIAKELFKRGLSLKANGKIKLYHYISPQIWAWKAKRRFTIAKYLDALGTIFPFEKEYYKDTNLDVQFLGHPFLDEDYALPLKYVSGGPILLLPGSRKTTVKKIFSIMLDTIKQLQKFEDIWNVIAIYPDNDILLILQEMSQKYKNISISFIPSSTKNIEARMALMSSGTMALKCALAGIPGIVVYKANVMTYGLAKMLIKVKFLHIANILLKKESAPEFLQFSAKSKLICQVVRKYLNNSAVLLQARKDAEELRQILSANSQNDVVTWIQAALI